ncbi:hypothetical protein [Rhizobium ruizarguesonis]|uniref:hypothetical protein n=1 Tax=Rhizobium ruizarguesonis TaxID=2081791 RepID=UPI001031A711|nr:hypothetical protein [Rhizobium ruizarguesonis]TBD81033.1 hypothetical protein ELH11_14585 [Rhizobium ruizarguesonis]TBE12194.1 hypothetical protein ELH09_14665 [Rhizobium ruizarguesonis]WSH32153.1 hypothetical protein U8P70_16510 [Rhizobium ruizarguesonis]
MDSEPTTKIAAIAAEAVFDAAKLFASSLGPLSGIIVRTAENSSKEIEAAAEKGIDELRNEIAKQELRLSFDLQQSKIAQELAIAHRITYAETVEIEEFYDRSGSGQAGLGVTESGINLGIKGDGKSVVKRIYKFSGNRPPMEITTKLDSGS